MPDTYQYIDNQIRSELLRLKNQRGLSYKKMAELSGLSEAKVKRIFNAPSTMRMSEARAINLILNPPVSLITALTVPIMSPENVAKAYEDLSYLHKLSISLQLGEFN